MSRVHYFADGYIREAEGDIRQSAWVCMYNPTDIDAILDFTFYYEDVAPTHIKGHGLKAHSAHNMHLNSCPEVLWNKRFGAKINSSVPTVVQITTGYYGLEDKPDWYTRAMHSVICADSLSKILYYADGLVLDNPGKRLKEPEWDFILNPNRHDAHAVLTAEYGDGVREEYRFDIGAERLVCFFKDPVVRTNQLFGARYISDLPIAVQQTRLIEEEDRVTIRSCYSVMAKPGPLQYQDGGLME